MKIQHDIQKKKKNYIFRQNIDEHLSIWTLFCMDFEYGSRQAMYDEQTFYEHMDTVAQETA